MTLGVTLFGKTPILQAVSQIDYKSPQDDGLIRLELFDLWPDSSENGKEIAEFQH